MHPAQYPDDNESKQKGDHKGGQGNDSEPKVNVELYGKNLPVENGKIKIDQGIQDQ